MGQSTKLQMPVNNHEQCCHSGLPFAPSSFSTHHPEGSFENTNLMLQLFPSFSPLQPHWPSSCSWNTEDIPSSGPLHWLSPQPGISSSGVYMACSLTPFRSLLKTISREMRFLMATPSPSYILSCFIFLHNHYNDLTLHYYLFVCKSSQLECKLHECRKLVMFHHCIPSSDGAIPGME